MLNVYIQLVLHYFIKFVIGHNSGEVQLICMFQSLRLNDEVYQELVLIHCFKGTWFHPVCKLEFRRDDFLKNYQGPTYQYFFSLNWNAFVMNE